MQEITTISNTSKRIHFIIILSQNSVMAQNIRSFAQKYIDRMQKQTYATGTLPQKNVTYVTITAAGF